jgi:hypothetical protein
MGSTCYLVAFLTAEDGIKINGLRVQVLDLFSEPTPTAELDGISVVLLKTTRPEYEDAMKEMANNIKHLAKHSEAWANVLGWLKCTTRPHRVLFEED